MELSEYRELIGMVSGLGAASPFVGDAVLIEAQEQQALRRDRAAKVAAKAREAAGGYVRIQEDRLRLTPEAALVSKALAKRLGPWARGLREERFDGPEAPFPGDEGEAADWIEAESAADRAQWLTESQASKVNAAAAEAEIRRLAELAGLDAKPHARFLRYGRPGDGHATSAPVFPGTFLDRLARETNRVSEQTAFESSSLTAHVLTGLTPRISRVRLTESLKVCRVPGDLIPSRWVTLRFNAADVTYDEVRSLYAEIREVFGATNADPLTWPEADFLSLVDGMEGPPDRGKTRFWEEVLRRWRAEPGAELLQLNSWRAVRQKYLRLDARKNIRELMTPNPETPETRVALRNQAREMRKQGAPELAARYGPNAQRSDDPSTGITAP